MARKSDVRMQFLRPAEIVARLKAVSVVYVPFGPLEWHGPHMPYGTDALNAEAVALAACRRTGGVVWPTQYWGTERERRPDQLRSLGFPADKYVVGMDFPKNLLKSMYCPEETFAIVVREVLNGCIRLGARVAVLVNGHGAENHMAVFKRLVAEFNASGAIRVHFRVAAPLSALTGSGGHADAGETSLMMHLCPGCVDLRALPPKGKRMKYTDHAVVDGPGFDGKGGRGGYLAADVDPRFHASAELGRRGFDQTVRELAAEVSGIMKRGKVDAPPAAS